MGTVIRAVTLPVGVPLGRSWEEINPVLRDCWRLSTHAANWCIQQLYRRDTVGVAKTPDAVRMGKEADGRFYAYGSAKSEPWFGDWAGAKQGLNICLKYAHRKYLAERFAVMVKGEQRLLTLRHPYPFPVDADGVKLSYADGGFPVVSLQLPGLGSVPFRLKRRADFGRQLAMFKQLHDGTAIKGEAAIYRNSKGDLLVKLVGKFPKREAVGREHVCLLHTDPAAFLVAEIDGRSPWILNADHLKRWQASHPSYRQRASEDSKREKRMDARQRAFLNQSRELRCDKHNHRLDTAVHQLTAQVARFCERQKVACVVYDDAIRDYLPEFQWHKVQTRLSYKLDALGIQFVARNSVPSEEFSEWLTNPKAVWSLALAGKRLCATKGRAKSRRSHPAVSTASAT